MMSEEWRYRIILSVLTSFKKEKLKKFLLYDKKEKPDERSY
jgi:hypothetical protein